MKFFTKKLYWFFCIVIFLWGCYCYNPLELYFQNDDFIHIPLSAKEVLFQRNSFRPLADLSVIADYHLWGKDAVGYHVTNFVLHILCSVLVFLFSAQVVGRYFKSLNARETGLSAALLFFVYATHSEAVLWILGRSAMLGVLFSLLFLLQYFKRKVSVLSILLCVTLFLAALLSYESSFILPLLCGVLYFIDRRKNDRLHLAIILVAFGIYLAARVAVTGSIFGTYEINNLATYGGFSAVINFGKLLLRCFVPAYTQGFFIVFLFCCIGIALLLFLISSRNRRSLIVLAEIFLITLLPYCTLGIDMHGYEGERFLYFPVLFLCLLISILLGFYNKNTVLTKAVFLFVLCCHCWSLAISARNFRFAGNVNKLIIGSIKQLKDVDTLYVRQLPQAQNGALIMRDGFAEAVAWLGEKKHGKIVVLSKRSEWLPLKEGYSRRYESVDNAAAASRTTELYFTDSNMVVKTR